MSLRVSAAMVAALAAEHAFGAYGRSGGQKRRALRRAISRYRWAIGFLPKGHPFGPAAMANLTRCLRVMFVATGDNTVLAEAVAWGRRAVDATGPSGPMAVVAYGNLSGALVARFETVGESADIDDAIRLLRAVLNANLDGTTASPAALHANLARSYLLRFQATVDPVDLETAISLARQAVAGADGTYRTACLYGLSGALHARYQVYGNLADLQEAIGLSDATLAVASTNHPELAGFLAHAASLAVNLHARTGDRGALRRAHDTYERVLDLMGTVPVIGRVVVANIGAMLAISKEGPGTVRLTPQRLLPLLRDYARNTGEGPFTATVHAAVSRVHLRLYTDHRADGDLDAAIAASRRSVALAVDDPDTCDHRSLLAGALLKRWADRGTDADLTEAVEHLQVAAGHRAASPSDLVTAAQMLGYAWWLKGDSTAAAEALGRAIDLLPMVAWPGSQRLTREYQLTQLDGLAAESAAAELANGQTRHAVAVLDAGRAVLWSQYLAHRADIDALGRVAPELAARLQTVRAALVEP